MTAIDYEKKLNILVVDDVEVHREMMKTFLLKVNPFIKVEQASSVVQAVEKLNTGKFNVVVSDWNLPDHGGDALLKWMRARANFNRVPFIMISANTGNEDIIHAFMTLGVDAYVTKPFKSQDLYDKVISAYQKRHGLT
jgi:two-component system chemotaxis response regulator CheY